MSFSPFSFLSCFAFTEYHKWKKIFLNLQQYLFKYCFFLILLHYLICLTYFFLLNPRLDDWKMPWEESFTKCQASFFSQTLSLLSPWCLRPATAFQQLFTDFSSIFTSSRKSGPIWCPLVESEGEVPQISSCSFLPLSPRSDCKPFVWIWKLYWCHISLLKPVVARAIWFQKKGPESVFGVS